MTRSNTLCNECKKEHVSLVVIISNLGRICSKIIAHEHICGKSLRCFTQPSLASRNGSHENQSHDFDFEPNYESADSDAGGRRCYKLDSKPGVIPGTKISVEEYEHKIKMRTINNIYQLFLPS